MFNEAFSNSMSASAPSAVSVGTAACPCGTGKTYIRCCEPLHQGRDAQDALELMRSRYTAYVIKASGYLLETWHPTTRPPTLDLADRPGLRTHWLGLQVISHRLSDPQRAEVSFIARVKVGGGPAQRLAERSRFLWDEGRWYYVDGDIGPK